MEARLLGAGAMKGAADERQAMSVGHRLAAASLVLAALGAGCARTPPALPPPRDGPLTRTWQSPERRQRVIDFLSGLYLRGYPDLGDVVLSRLLAGAELSAGNRASLHRVLGKFYAHRAETLALERHDMEAFIQHLELARNCFRSFLDHGTRTGEARDASDRADVLLRLGRIELAIAEALARATSGSPISEADSRRRAERAVEACEAAVRAFGEVAQQNVARVAELDARVPPAGAGAEAHERWQTTHRAAREQDFRVRLELAMARRRGAKLLERLGPSGSARSAQLAAAERELRRLRREFAGTLGSHQASLELARILTDKDGKADAEALELLTSVWGARAGFSRYKRIPCDAERLRASILLRRGKVREALGVLDSLVAFASDGVWRPGHRSVAEVVEVLRAVPESDREAYDRRAVAEVLLMEAEALALLAEDTDPPLQEPRRLYRAALDVAAGVAEVLGVLDPKYTGLLSAWSANCPGPTPLALLRQRYADAVREKRYAEAAALMTEIASRQTLQPPGRLAPEAKLGLWFAIGQCYHSAGRGPEAAIAFLGAARWFPQAPAKAHEAAQAAISAADAHLRRTKDPADQQLRRWVRAQAASSDPLAPGSLLVREADAARRAGKLRRAIELLERVRPDDDTYPDALCRLILAHKASLGQLPDAQRAGREGRLAAQQMAAIHKKLVAEARRRRPELARRGDKAAVTRLAALVGTACHALEEYAEAIPYLEEADAAYEKHHGEQGCWHPGHPGVLEKLADCYLATRARDRYERALRAYSVLQLHCAGRPKRFWAVFVRLCETLRRLGRYEQALDKIETSSRGLPARGSDAVRALLIPLVKPIQEDAARIGDFERRHDLLDRCKRLLERLRRRAPAWRDAA